MATSIEIAQRLSKLYCPLSEASIEALAGILIRNHYRKGVRVLDEGEICLWIMFIEEGMLRQFYTKRGKDVTEHFGYENSIVMCLESLIKQEPTHLMVEALENSIVWQLPRVELERLSEKHADISTMYRRIYEESLIVSQIKADALRFETAQEKYNKLLKHYPEIPLRAPLIYIASYLQMTPETLSRVRSALL